MKSVPPVISGDSDYAYATGVVRGKWARRLDKSALNRIIEAPKSGVSSALSETGFSSSDLPAGEAIRLAWEETVSLVESLSKNPEVTQLLRLSTDFTNAAAALKAGLFDFEYEPLHLPGGLASSEDLTAAASGESPDSVPGPVLEGMRLASALYREHETGFIIDLALDSYFGAIFAERLLHSGRKFLGEYARRWIDSANISGFLRLRLAEMPPELFDRFFIEGGSISRKQFDEMRELEDDSIPGWLHNTAYGKVLSNAAGELFREKSFAPLERFIEELLEDYLRQNVYVSFGLEVVLSYALLKRREIRTVAAIVRLKGANIGADEIRERLSYGEI